MAKTTQVRYSVPETFQGESRRRRRRAKIHVIVNRKGGVGKTLISINMAATTSDVVGVADDGRPIIAYATADPQGDGPDWAARIAELPFDYLDISQDVEDIQHLRELPYDHIFVDTPGWLPIKEEEFKAGRDPLARSGETGELLRAIFAQADDFVIPILTEGQSFLPTHQTIEQVIRPLGKPFQVLINNWNPSESDVYVDGARDYCAKWGWPVARTVIRRYRLHANASLYGEVVTQYKASSTASKCREDFYKWALEHGLSGAEARYHDLTGANVDGWAPAETVGS